MSKAQPQLQLAMDTFWISPYVFTVYVSLKEKGLEFQLLPIALHKKEQLNEAYQKLSPTGKVPTLVHNGFALAESNAIVDYLDEAFPAPKYPRLFPQDVHNRAVARMLMAWIRSEVLALRHERPTSSMFYERAKAPLSADGKAAAEKLIRMAMRVVPEGKTQLFDEWSIADADLAFILHRLILNGDELPSRIRKFAETQWSRRSVQEFVNHKRDTYVPY